MRLSQVSPATRGYILGVLFLVCTLAALLVGRASSQAAPPPNQEVGRYQIVPAGTALNPFIYFVDTKTGQCWEAYTPAEGQKSEGWHKVPVPVSSEAR